MMLAQFVGWDDGVKAYYEAADAEAARQGFKDFREVQEAFELEPRSPARSTAEAGDELADIMNALPAGFWELAKR